jgi:acetolactate synthase I/II/III large subunit
MLQHPHRRETIQTAAVVGTALVAAQQVSALGPRSAQHTGIVSGRMTGARAIADCLAAEGVGCVYGIPGAQENELWDEFKQRNIPYLLSAHEYGAACMADGYARSTGRPGVLCIVPGPGVTNALTGLGEALLDSSPIVAIVGDIANGDHYRPFQVHSLSQVDLLKPVCKGVFPITTVGQIAVTIRKAFQLAMHGEPGPVAVVVPFNLLIEMAEFHAPPAAAMGLPCDEAAIQKAIALLANPAERIGIYAGFGCMNFSAELTAVAQMLQAPVATSVSGKGCIPESHALSVGWGFGPHASSVAETVFEKDALHPFKTGVTTLLAIGVKFSEVSTGLYGNPKIPTVIHVDTNECNLGKAYPATLGVHADAGLFLNRLLACPVKLTRPADARLRQRITAARHDQAKVAATVRQNPCGIDPLAVVTALQNHLPKSSMLFTDVSASEHLAAEHYRVCEPRSYFNPVDNQAMGWALPAAIGAAHVHHDRTVAVLAGDGCLLMTMPELATAAREHIAVKLFVLDDHAYHYMQILQQAAYKRTTATLLAKLDYCALAKGFGIGYREANTMDQLKEAICGGVAMPGPVLVRIATDYGDRKIRWIEAVRSRFTKELSPSQRARFLARVSARTLTGAARTSD